MDSRAGSLGLRSDAGAHGRRRRHRQSYVSTLNAYQGTLTANAAIVPAGAAGAISVFVTDATNLVIDVNGYFGQ